MPQNRNPQYSFGDLSPPPPPPRPFPAWLKKLLIALAIVAPIGAYLYYDPSLIAPYLQDTPLELPARVTKAYKWRNADGSWQMSDRPPPSGTSFKVIEVNTDANVMPLAPKQ